MAVIFTILSYNSLNIFFCLGYSAIDFFLCIFHFSYFIFHLCLVVIYILVFVKHILFLPILCFHSFTRILAHLYYHYGELFWGRLPISSSLSYSSGAASCKALLFCLAQILYNTLYNIWESVSLISCIYILSQKSSSHKHCFINVQRD